MDTETENPLATPERHLGRLFERTFSTIWYKFLHNAEWGLYPKEYNPRVHGIYQPWRNYGKVDTPIGDVKLGELPNWFGRRSYAPRAMLAAFSRFRHNYYRRWLMVRRPNTAPFIQLIAASAIYCYYLRYKQAIKYAPQFRYH